MIETTETAQPQSRGRRAGEAQARRAGRAARARAAEGGGHAGARLLVGPAVHADRQHAGLLAQREPRQAVGDRLLSWVGLAYLWKFVWGAIVDHTAAPAARRLGRRRGWMIVTQVVVGVGLAGMALVGARAPALARPVRPGGRDRGGHAGHGDRRLADRDRQRRRRARPADRGLQPRLPRGPDRDRGPDPDGRHRDRLGHCPTCSTAPSWPSASSPPCWRASPRARRRGDGAKRRAQAGRLAEGRRRCGGRAVHRLLPHPRGGPGGADAADDHALSPVRLHARADEQPLLRGPAHLASR